LAVGRRCCATGAITEDAPIFVRWGWPPAPAPRLTGRSALSLTPGFSPVECRLGDPSRFNGFPHRIEAAEAAESFVCRKHRAEARC